MCKRTRVSSFSSFGAVVFLACLTGLTLSCSDKSANEQSVQSGLYDPHTAAAECAGCHPNHVAEWRSSAHAYALVDPVFSAMVRIGQAETHGQLDQFCTRCHSPIGSLQGETKVSLAGALGIYQQKTEGLSPAAMSGVSCEACHSIVGVEEHDNGRFVLKRDGIRRARLDRPVPTNAHGTAYSALHGASKLCGTCHMVVNERFTQPVAVEETFIEWVQSVFPGQQECQDCHMPSYEGHAANGGPERIVHRHQFVGVDVPLVDEGAFPGYSEMRTLTEQLLKSSAVLTASSNVEQKRLEVAIKNLAGHALPSGAVSDREMWLEVRVHDGAGNPVFESGTLDENGDLRVADASRTTRPGTDPALVLYTERLHFDPALEKPPQPGARRDVDFLWQPNDKTAHLIEVSATDRVGYDLGALAAGDYSADVRLLFRSFPPHLLRRLEREANLSPEVAQRVPIVEMQTVHVTWTQP